MKTDQLGFIIQARCGSTRLPNKVLLPFYNTETILDRQIGLLKNNFSQYPILIATTTCSSDDAIVDKYKADKKVKIFRGDENNVLKRFVDAAKANNIFHIVRICADNPFLSLPLMKKLLDEYFKAKPDYASYRFKDGLPAIKSHLGLFVEVTNVSALIKITQSTTDSLYHEHVTNYMYSHAGNKFNIYYLPVPEMFNKYEKKLRLTIDTKEDFQQLQKLHDLILHKYGEKYNLENLLKEVDNNINLQESMLNMIKLYEK